MKELDTQTTLIATIEALMSERGLSQADVARQSSVGATQLNQWLKGKYPGDNAAIDDSMQRWLNSTAATDTDVTKLLTQKRWADTQTSNQITDKLLFAQTAGDVVVVYGGAGVGKTETARRYAMGYSSVWHVTMSADTASKQAALEEIAITMGMRDYPSTPAGLRRVIEARIRGTGGLLIIDEAQELKKEALESVRTLHDRTGVGLALLGNEKVYSQLTGSRRQADFAQLFSRIGSRQRLIKPKKSDIKSVAQAWGITAKPVLDLLSDLGQKPGGLRSVVKTLRQAVMMTGKAHPQLSSEEIVAAWKEHGGDANA